jgi:hypothetical protein
MPQGDDQSSELKKALEAESCACALPKCRTSAKSVAQRGHAKCAVATRKWSMLCLLSLLLALMPVLLRSRRDLLLENLALRQQLATLTQRHSRPRLAGSDREIPYPCLCQGFTIDTKRFAIAVLLGSRAGGPPCGDAASKLCLGGTVRLSRCGQKTSGREAWGRRLPLPTRPG